MSGVIRDHYRACDAIVGQALSYADGETLLVVLSDHGMSSFQRGLHLNSWLHEQGLRTALNLHPAKGIYPHEAQYEEMAEWMGIDPSTQQPIPFDIADPHFMEGYFKILHHSYESPSPSGRGARGEGVDFWWMDWQQGKKSQVEGLDPLWMLNHLHFHDLGRDGRKRPFVFSRWGGLGNHRYPIGFSGHLCALERACLPAALHRHRSKRRLWLVESRHRRTHGRH